jgi:hypothetical protein
MYGRAGYELDHDTAVDALKGWVSMPLSDADFGALRCHRRRHG